MAGVSSVPLLPLGVEEAVERVEGRLLCELDSLPPRDRWRRRDIAAGFALDVWDCAGAGAASSASVMSASPAFSSSRESASPSSGSTSLSAFGSWYCDHRSSTCAKLRGWRCSKLAARHSKAYAQWA